MYCDLFSYIYSTYSNLQEQQQIQKQFSKAVQ
jgi:hypothetical protein